MQHGKYFAMMRPEGEVVRFVIRDRAGLRPSIHGYGRSMDEARTKIDEILGALDNLEHERADERIIRFERNDEQIRFRLIVRDGAERARRVVRHEKTARYSEFGERGQEQTPGTARPLAQREARIGYGRIVRVLVGKDDDGRASARRRRIRCFRQRPALLFQRGQ